MTDDPMLDLNLNFKLAPKKLLEKDIENAVCRYAATLDIKGEKFTSPGRRSVPDRMFSCTNGFVFFIEFKAPGKKATRKQRLDHEDRQRRGFHVFVVDDIAQGRKIVDFMMREAEAEAMRL